VIFAIRIFFVHFSRAMSISQQSPCLELIFNRLNIDFNGTDPRDMDTIENKLFLASGIDSGNNLQYVTLHGFHLEMLFFTKVITFFAA